MSNSARQEIERLRRELLWARSEIAYAKSEVDQRLRREMLATLIALVDSNGGELRMRQHSMANANRFRLETWDDFATDERVFRTRDEPA